MAGTTNNTPWTKLVVGAAQYKANGEAGGASFGVYYPFLNSTVLLTVMNSNQMLFKQQVVVRMVICCYIFRIFQFLVEQQNRKGAVLCS